MSHPSSTQRTVAAATMALLLIIATSCGKSRPSSSNYLGKWEGTVESLTGSEGRCHLDISTVGESLVIKSERQRIGNCVAYEGVWTLTPEGNLKGGPMGSMLISYDKKATQAVVSGLGGLRYLRRPSQQDLDAAVYAGTWRLPSNGRAFKLEELEQGGFQYTAGMQESTGGITWTNRWPVQVDNGVLVVRFAEGSAKISKAQNDELDYVEDQGFVEGDNSGSKPQKAIRVRE